MTVNSVYKALMAVAMLAVTLPAWAERIQVIDVFDTPGAPVTGLDEAARRTGAEVRRWRIVDLDQMQDALEKKAMNAVVHRWNLPQDPSRWPELAQRGQMPTEAEVVEYLKGTGMLKEYEEAITQTVASLGQAMKLRVERLPAVVIDKKYVVYGARDVRIALERYKRETR